MKFRTKNVSIRTGDVFVALVHFEDAKRLDLWPGDRIAIRKKKAQVTAIIDVTRSSEVVRPGFLGLFKDVSDKICTDDVDVVDVRIEDKPESIAAIKKKLLGKKLTKADMYSIVSDIAARRLTAIEMTYFVSACFVHDLSFEEVKFLTDAMIRTGEKLPKMASEVYDKHCSGGVAGNRTTPIIVAIVAAAGLTIPKTSSRSITSPAGTADTMEVICKVGLSIDDIKRVVKKEGGCIAWGGNLNLAPADDVLIQIERPLSIDSEGQMIASIMAKKLSVSSNRILIDLCVSADGKLSPQKGAKLKKNLIKLGKAFGAKVEVLLTDGSRPIGHGMGPALEARDVLWVLQNDPRGPADLRKKSVMMAGVLLGMSGKFKNPHEKAEELLISGLAWKKFQDICRNQGSAVLSAEQIAVGPYQFHVKASKSGKVVSVSNEGVVRICHAVGAPLDKSSGVYLYKHVGDAVRKNELLYTVYAFSERKLEYAKRFAIDGIFRIV